MVRRPAGARRRCPGESECFEVQRLDECVHRPHRVVLGDVVVSSLFVNPRMSTNVVPARLQRDAALVSGCGLRGAGGSLFISTGYGHGIVEGNSAKSLGVFRPPAAVLCDCAISKAPASPQPSAVTRHPSAVTRHPSAFKCKPQRTRRRASARSFPGPPQMSHVPAVRSPAMRKIFCTSGRLTSFAGACSRSSQASLSLPTTPLRWSGVGQQRFRRSEPNRVEPTRSCEDRSVDVSDRHRHPPPAIRHPLGSGIETTAARGREQL